jgi:uncharacterized cupin superfamily protein
MHNGSQRNVSVANGREHTNALKQAGHAGATSTLKIRVSRPPHKDLEKLGVFQWPIWTKDPSDFDWHYDAQESCYLLEGEAEVRTSEGVTKFAAGDFVVFPAGLDCKWRIKKAVKKHYKFG